METTPPAAMLTPDPARRFRAAGPPKLQTDFASPPSWISPQDPARNQLWRLATSRAAPASVLAHAVLAGEVVNLADCCHAFNLNRKKLGHVEVDRKTAGALAMLHREMVAAAARLGLVVNVDVEPVEVLAAEVER